MRAEKLKQQYTAQVAGLLDTAGVVPANSAPAPRRHRQTLNPRCACVAPPKPVRDRYAPSANKDTARAVRAAGRTH